MKKSIPLIAIAFLFVACSPKDASSPKSLGPETIIDWVDFIKMNDQQYESIHSGIISDPGYVGEEIGEVTFEVNENVTNPHYKTKNGDAAFWPKGTKIFAVKNMPEFIAVQDNKEINNYQIYMDDSSKSPPRRFKNIDLENINKVEFYQGYNEPNLIQTYSSGEIIHDLISLLENGTEKPSYEPDISNGDPEMFHFVLYDQQPIAYTNSFSFDGNKWFWYPDELEILPDDIEKFVEMED